MTLDRSEIARALAKAIAYKQCGKQAEAAAWARQLVELLECAEILQPTASLPAEYSLVGLTNPAWAARLAREGQRAGGAPWSGPGPCECNSGGFCGGCGHGGCGGRR